MARELLHLVARAAGGARPFEQRHACADLWARLARTFDLVACTFMPNHVHVLAQVDRDVATRAFARVLSAFRLRMRAFGAAPIEFEWESLPRPEKVQYDKRHIARTVRYIHLNPVRDGLCDDPLEWEWSTHRDWLGAVAHSCVDRARWARAMGRRPSSCAEWLHEYVSSDASVRSARPLADPRPFLGDEPKDASIDALTTAVACVLRSGRTTLAEFGSAERRLFLLSAARWTRYRAPELARHLCLHQTNVRKVMRRVEERPRAGLAAASAGSGSGSASGVGSRSASATANSNGAIVRPARSQSLSGDELRAMALVLADRRLSAPILRGAVPERPSERPRRVGW